MQLSSGSRNTPSNLSESDYSQPVRSSCGVTNLPLLVLFLLLAPTALASSTWYVDGVNGSDNNNCKSPQTACKTITHAISHAAYKGDSITVAPAIYVEDVTTRRVELTIVGSDAKTTIIDGGGGGPVITTGASRSKIILSKLTLRNGLSRHGGGIRNNGTMTVNDCTLTGNHSHSGPSPEGGGILNTGTMTINNSTLTGNYATADFRSVGAGGGIKNTGTMTINNSTLAGNHTNAGGGIYNSSSGKLTINNSTLAGNYVKGRKDASRGGAIYNAGTVTINNSTLNRNKSAANNGGGGIYGTATLQNTIIANSPSGGNCSGTMTSNGYNLSSDNTCNFNSTGDLNNTDPNLGKLGYYGGATETIQLLSGSPAIDAGNPNGCTDGQGHLLMTDQRGKPRPDKEDTGGCDMGAYERQKD